MVFYTRIGVGVDTKGNLRTAEKLRFFEILCKLLFEGCVSCERSALRICNVLFQSLRLNLICVNLEGSQWLIGHDYCGSNISCAPYEKYQGAAAIVYMGGAD